MSMTTSPASVTTTTATSATPSRQALTSSSTLGDKDTFLKLVVAQLRHQDPMNPSKPEEMAAQLAQFSSLETQLAIRDLLQSQQASDALMQNTLDIGSAMGTIGHEVMARGSHITVGTDSDVTVDVAGVGGMATLRIYDGNGKEVATQALGALQGGEQTISLARATAGLRDGTYTYAVEVADEDGIPVDVQPYQRMVVDAVEPGRDGPVLCAGALRVSFADLVRVGPLAS